MISSVIRFIRQQVDQKHTRDIMVVFAIQAFALLTSLSISLLITNILGAAAYGAFSYGFSWVNLVATFSCMGFEQLALKEVPAYRAAGKSDLIRGLFRFSMKRVLTVSVIATLMMFTVSWLIQQPADEMLRKGLWLALPVLPVTALINLRFAWLRSEHWNTLSQLPDKVIRPAVFLVSVLIIYFIWKESLNVWLVILLSAASILLALVIGNYFVNRRVISTIAEVTPVFESEKWMKTAFALLLVNGVYFYLSQLQIIALGSLRGAKDTGVFAIASRLSDLEGYMLFAMNVVLAPIISRLYAEKKMEELQRIITGSLRTGFIFSIPVIALFLNYPTFFLQLFGDEFGEGRLALMILTVSQIVNFGTGSVGYLLTMTGHQKTALQLLFSCALLTTVLTFFLIPSFGINGAAIAAGINNILLNVLMAVAVYRKTGINSTLLRFK